jgi:hypothetical protein
MKAAEAIGGNHFERFCAPQGDPNATQRLAWRRSAVRFQLLLALRSDQSSEELSYIIDHLSRASVSAKHRALAAPEMALYISALLNDSIPNADIAVPVLVRVATLNATAESRRFSWAGTLPLDYLPLGERVIRRPGQELHDPELVLNDDRMELFSPNCTAPVSLNFKTGATANCSCRAHKLEIVDGWGPFSDLFNDGNVSVNFDKSSRLEFLKVLDHAVDLIKVVMPAALEEMAETAQYLSPIRPSDRATNALPSFSSPILPGVIFVGTERGDGRLIDVGHLAESCIHEHLHNRLYLLDEALPLTFKTANPRSYFSPWKEAMRPVEGMLHAIYVFSHLTWFWRRAGEKREDLAEYAANSVSEHSEHIAAATAEIDIDELTPAGRRILSASTALLDNLP